MAQKPLDTAFGPSSETKKKKRGAFVAIAAVVGLAGISSVFAANVGINGGSGISFSQGTTTIAACDTDGITAALSSYYDAAGAAFNLDTITLTGVSDTCDGKTLTLDLYDGTSQLVTVTGVINSDASTTVDIGYPGGALDSANAVSGSGTAENILQGTVTVTYLGDPLSTAANLASNADRIVIEIN